MQKKNKRRKKKAFCLALLLHCCSFYSSASHQKTTFFIDSQISNYLFFLLLFFFFFLRILYTSNQILYISCCHFFLFPYSLLSSSINIFPIFIPNHLPLPSLEEDWSYGGKCFVLWSSLFPFNSFPIILPLLVKFSGMCR